MNVYHDLNELPPFKNAVVTIGSFDGVHKGHQRILEKLKQLAEERQGESVVVTFHPHPRQIVSPEDKTLRLLTTIDEKISLLRTYGVDNVVVVPFTNAFSQQRADEYIEKFLMEKFNPKCIVIGYDHKFGLNRQGDINYLRWYGEAAGFEVIEIPKQEIDELSVSSTRIRKATEEGNVKKASKLLGHYFMLTGTVVHGQQLGTQLGFPTANIEVNSEYKLIPPDGVYAVYVWHQKQRYEGMLYIGYRPTMKDGPKHRSIEVNIFNFAKNIYGDKLKLELIDFIREDRAFDGIEQLKTQLKTDEQQVKECLQYEDTFMSRTVDAVQPYVAIVILNYNGAAYLRQFLPSVLKTMYANYKIYVADNGSTDDSLAVLAQEFPEVGVIDLKTNYGFAEGYNRALHELEADYYVLLNSDVEVMPDWIKPIMELMERDHTVAACQPRILDFNKRSHFEYAGAAGGWIDRLGYPFCRGRLFQTLEEDRGQYHSTQEIFWASGAAMFIRAQLFHDIGGFDGDYFAHLEEIDLCWRLKRAGYKIMVRPKSVVYHVGGGTLAYENPRKTYLNFRNSLFTLLKNEDRNKLLWLLPLRLVLDGLAGVLFLTKGQFKNIGAIIKAHWHFFFEIRATLKKRKRLERLIQKTSIQTTPNEAGRYEGSIVWQYYIQRNIHFSKLKPTFPTKKIKIAIY